MNEHKTIEDYNLEAFEFAAAAMVQADEDNESNGAELVEIVIHDDKTASGLLFDLLISESGETAIKSKRDKLSERILVLLCSGYDCGPFRWADVGVRADSANCQDYQS